jgi:predicted hexulose-6-phosphate isomerase
MGQMLIMVKNKKYQLGMYEKSMPSNLTWLEKLECLNECGFDYLEISIDESDNKQARLNWDEEQKQELKDAMIKTGVRVNSICLSGHRKYPFGASDLEVQKQSLEIMEKAINFAVEFGIRIIQLAGYDVYYEEGNQQTREDFEKNLKLATEMAAKKGVMLGFETMETAFMDTVEKSMNYVNIVDSPYLGVYPDIGNLTNSAKLYGHDIFEDIKTGKGHIVAAHLKETIVGHYREIPFGTGHTDFDANIELLKNLGVRLFVGEFWYVGQENWKDDCKFAARFLRKNLDKVFN